MAKKIMFNDEYGLTRAVLECRKTMTRRIIKYPKSKPPFSDFIGDYDEAKEKGYLDYGNGIVFFLIEDRNKSFLCAPSYKVGEVVAIAQSYRTINEFYEIAYKRHNSFHGQIVTKYDIPFKEIVKWFNLRESLKDTAGWTNKMFVKADLMIFHIRIINIKIERLQDISDKDCLKEGIYEDSGDDEFPPSIFYEFEGNKDDGFDTPREAFATLIDKVSGKGTWESNPYVFVYEFELVD